MPGEFEGLERATRQVASAASKVERWASGLTWEEPKQPNNPFKGIKNFDTLKEKYAELIVSDYAQKRSQLNVYYLQHLILINNNFIKALTIIYNDYKKLEARKQQSKTTDAEPEKFTMEEFKNRFKFDEKTGEFVDKNAPQQSGQTKTQQPSANAELQKELDANLKSLLQNFGFYRQALTDENYLNNKLEFIKKTASTIRRYITKYTKKLELYQQEVSTGKVIPKKEKVQQPQQAVEEAPKTTDSNLTATNKKIKLKIKK